MCWTLLNTQWAICVQSYHALPFWQHEKAQAPCTGLRVVIRASLFYYSALFSLLNFQSKVFVFISCSAGVNRAEQCDIFYIVFFFYSFEKKKSVVVRRHLCEIDTLRCLSEVRTLIYAIVMLSLSLNASIPDVLWHIIGTTTLILLFNAACHYTFHQ